MIVIRCSDCNIIIQVNPDGYKEKQEQYSMCPNCIKKANGYRGVQNDREIGVT